MNGRQGNGNPQGGYSSSQTPGGYGSSYPQPTGGYVSSAGVGNCNQHVVYSTQTYSNLYQPYYRRRVAVVEYEPICCNLL